MDWITSQIAIGNFIDAKNASPIDIDAILCLKTGCWEENDDPFDILCLSLKAGIGNTQRDVTEAIVFIEDAMQL